MTPSSASSPAQAPASSSARPRRRVWRIVLIVVAAVLVIGLVAGAVWLRPYTASAAAQTALHSDGAVTVTNGDKDIAFLPHVAPKLGLIFYPGAKVEPAAYAVYMHALAAQGYATFIAKMPLNIALLNENAAADIMAAHPAITTWAIGGHSLGGVAACDFAKGHHSIQGILLFAAYPNGSIASLHVSVLSVSGSRDGLATPAKVNAAKPDLPASTQYVIIQGGVHAYFGDYGPQDGDGTPTISRDEARQQILAASAAWLATLAPLPVNL
jgi:dienelactone hydrolase